MKRFAFYFLAALLLLGYFARRSQAQFIGFTSPQTVTSTPFNNVTCTGSPQRANVPNLGQNEHQVVFVNEGGPMTSATVTLQGSNDGLAFFNISDPASGVSDIAFSAQGYYSVVAVEVTCTATAQFTVQYSGTSGTPGDPQGTIKTTFLDKNLVTGASAGSNFTVNSLVTPYGNSSGLIYFIYLGGSGPAGSTITVSCSSVNVTNGITYTFSPTNAGTPQTFSVPSNPCTFLAVTYTSGGASANAIALDYVYSVPGSQVASGAAAANVNVAQIGGISASLPLPVSGTVSTTPPSTDPCQSPGVAKNSAFLNVTTATTTALVPVSGSTIVYVCGFDLDITSTTTASTALLEQGTGTACSGSPIALTPTYTNGSAVNSFKSVSTGGTVFKTAASNGLCAVSTVGSTPTTGVRISYVQQ